MAMSILPIGKQADGESTLCYGSCDGGKTVVTSDLRFNRYMEQMGYASNAYYKRGTAAGTKAVLMLTHDLSFP